MDLEVAKKGESMRSYRDAIATSDTQTATTSLLDFSSTIQYAIDPNPVQRKVPSVELDYVQLETSRKAHALTLGHTIQAINGLVLTWYAGLSGAPEQFFPMCLH